MRDRYPIRKKRKKRKQNLKNDKRLILDISVLFIAALSLIATLFFSSLNIYYAIVSNRPILNITFHDYITRPLILKETIVNGIEHPDTIKTHVMGSFILSVINKGNINGIFKPPFIEIAHAKKEWFKNEKWISFEHMKEKYKEKYKQNIYSYKGNLNGKNAIILSDQTFILPGISGFIEKAQYKDIQAPNGKNCLFLKIFIEYETEKNTNNIFIKFITKFLTDKHKYLYETVYFNKTFYILRSEKL